METKEITLLVWDSSENFNLNTTQRSLGSGNVFKSLRQFNCLDMFDKIIDKIEDDEKLLLCCHVGYGDFGLYLDFKNSGITEKYNIVSVHYLSSIGESATIKYKEQFGEFEKILFYNKFIQNVRAGDIKPFTKQTLMNIKSKEKGGEMNKAIDIKIDYVIITALEEDEMEKVLPFIKKEGCLDFDKKLLIEHGHFISDTSIKIAYASQPTTGMIDAAILGTRMIMEFSPKFIIMAGVLGGKPQDTNIGDIIVSSKVFTIDKGKLTDTELEREIENSNIESAHIVKLKREKNKILKYIKKLDETRKGNLNIHFGPLACVRQVVDKKGYFEDNITILERKAIGLEMEAYGIVRACELINNGNTSPIIIKSVMDNTIDKTDNSKTYAAWTSATFIKYLFENKLI